MSHDDLDELFRASPAGPIQVGEGDGTAIFAPDTPVSDVATKLTRLLAWNGKVFDPEGVLRNEIGPTGAHAIRAEVYYAESWSDQKEAVILDYRETSLVAHWIRDEICLVAQGLYLVNVSWTNTKFSILHCILPHRPLAAGGLRGRCRLARPKRASGLFHHRTRRASLCGCRG
ncbi:MAG TPA: hypothetical protein VJW23_03935 [Propionibacteriaceae bacterium]|nr:hypothetical protein [Propionibacteriaceae bacterium]